MISAFAVLFGEEGGFRLLGLHALECLLQVLQRESAVSHDLGELGYGESEVLVGDEGLGVIRCALGASVSVIISHYISFPYAVCVTWDNHYDRFPGLGEQGRGKESKDCDKQ